MIPYNSKLVPNAKALRRNMTKEEKHLWYDFLKRLPFAVKRQHNIENYIVDFYIANRKLVIELDGVQHSTPDSIEYDQARENVLSKWGMVVVRYTNRQVNQQFNCVCQDILNRLGLSFSDLKEVKDKR
ncbi:MAG: DUF559 domain-containing protein [Clostridia bacterium]|nr:DUF559 domain-containing protein [Clostridia bacterium]